ncbi:MAG: phenylalanine--tRNA ligase subunit alpha [Candidatus Uhrbacteria bacterium]|nr:phenylalanine--tRNA ligase subunit alpha [Candidatus Uhrbacteria bacterium]
MNFKMDTNIDTIQSEAIAHIQDAKTIAELEAIELSLFGRKQGVMTEILKGLKDLDPQTRKTEGRRANDVKVALQNAIDGKRMELIETETGDGDIDVTECLIPPLPHGTLHPITLISEELEDMFFRMGFRVYDGPELESDYYNFEGLNFAADHPARDMQDTFYIKDLPGRLLRTHTSTVQVRAMREYGAPLSIIAPGRCFRNEETDARHEHTFFQLEGFIVGSDITFAHLKGILEVTARYLYGSDTRVRLRPKYYPFVEPGVSGEVTCLFCHGNGCRLCKLTGFLEIFGAGRIHPNVLRAGGLDPKKLSGLAFGFGLTRLAMLKYGIDDVRLFESGDLAFLKQF